MGNEAGQFDREAALSILDWWREGGVDTLVSEEPRNWISPPKAAVRSEIAVPAERAPMPQDLDGLLRWIAESPDVPGAATGGKRIAPVGKAGAALMILADFSDDPAAEPIGGQQRELFERMMAAIGIAADDRFTATLRCFVTSGSRPDARAIEECSGLARRLVKAVSPRKLLLFGDAPARALLGEPLTRARGRPQKVDGIRTVATFHPRWLIDRPADKALAWRDLLLLMED